MPRPAKDFEDQIIELVSTILDLEPEEVSLEFEGEKMDEWDSLAHLTIMSAVEQEFNVNISPEEAKKLGSIPKICNFLNEAMN